MTNFKLFSEQYRELKTTLELLTKEKKFKEREIKILTDQQEKHVKARYVLTEVSRNTQQRFKDRVETLITLAIQSVFERPFKFKLNMEMARNKFSCFPVVEEEGNEYIPSEEMGGGILDIISFAFRIVLWSLKSPRSRSLFILDEPMKFVGKDELLQRAVMMIKEISERMGLQFVIVTHEPQIAEIADKAYGIIHNGEHSVLTDI
jgi:DNA repair exonuclease SbcCD ATPase subunit